MQSEDTALIRAAVHGRTDCVRMLIDVGADKDSKNSVRVPCMYACICILGVLTNILSLIMTD